MNFNAKTRAALNADGKDASDATRRDASRPAESRHNPQFRLVRRAKISPFGEQEASHGLILTPLGMTSRARATVRLLVVGCAVPASAHWHARSFSLKRKTSLDPRDYFFQLHSLRKKEKRVPFRSFLKRAAV